MADRRCASLYFLRLGSDVWMGTSNVWLVDERAQPNLVGTKRKCRAAPGTSGAGGRPAVPSAADHSRL